MPIYDLFTNPAGLPSTLRSRIPYEIEALTPKEVWGAGNGNTTLVCRQKWDRSATWIKDMVGEVKVERRSSDMILKRHVPEMLQYNLEGDGNDTRIQWCTLVDQAEQGGQTEGSNMAMAVSGWPEVLWCKYRVTWEATPYAILGDARIGSLPRVADITGEAGANAGASELTRYVMRTRKSYSKEMTVPGANVGAGTGFHVIDADPVKRKPVPGGFVFKVLGYETVSITWIRIPIGWPPPVGYLSAAAAGVGIGPVRWPPTVNPTGAAIDPGTKRRTRDSFKGCVNDRWFDVAAPDGIAAPPGTLLYQGYDDSKKYFDAAGDWVCDIRFDFIGKSGVDAAGTIGGWNYYLDASNRYVEVSADAVPGDNKRGTPAGQRPYKSVNFDDLFQWS
jgi:hypothetical protein